MITIPQVCARHGAANEYLLVENASMQQRHSTKRGEAAQSLNKCCLLNISNQSKDAYFKQTVIKLWNLCLVQVVTTPSAREFKMKYDM